MAPHFSFFFFFPLQGKKAKEEKWNHKKKRGEKSK
jgi:hypothetical protein